jgi:apolipoprotein N-acyltransferase
MYSRSHYQQFAARPANPPLNNSLRKLLSSLAAAPANFAYLTSLTFYTRHGDWFPWLCALAALAALARRPSRLRQPTL